METVQACELALVVEFIASHFKWLFKIAPQLQIYLNNESGTCKKSEDSPEYSFQSEFERVYAMETVCIISVIKNVLKPKKTFINL